MIVKSVYNTADSRKRKQLSVEAKYEIIMACAAGVKKADIACDFEIPRNTLSTILKNREEIISAFNSSTFSPTRNKLCVSNYSDVEWCVLIIKLLNGNKASLFLHSHTWIDTCQLSNPAAWFPL